MRKLFFVPIIHTRADMGSLSPALSEKGIALIGKERWQKHVETVNGFWNSIAQFLNSLEVRGFKIYQDGLVAGEKEGLRIVEEGARLGSANYRTISSLLKRGALLVKTEDISLVKKEHDYIAEIADAKSLHQMETAARKYKLAQRSLLEERDRVISQTIARTLKEGDTGILFIGASHDVLSKLPADICVVQVKDLARVRKYHRTLTEQMKQKGYPQELAEYLTSPIVTGPVAPATVFRGKTQKQPSNKMQLLDGKRFYPLIENASDLITVISADGTIIYESPSVERVLGYRPAELTGKNLIEFIHSDDVESFRKVIKQAIATSEPIFGAIIRARHKDGSWRFLESTSKNALIHARLEGIVINSRDITERKQALHEIQQSLLKARKTIEGIIETMALIIEVRDPYITGHQNRVAQLSLAIAKKMGLPSQQLDAVRFAAFLHDIGKISVPGEILSKAGELTEAEFDMIRAHPQVGYDILKTIEFPWPIAQIVLQHHERSNGSGYPSGIIGENILLEARIIGVSDVVEAMSSHRPYRPALGIDQALKEILQNRGILYDPDVVDTCLKLFTKGLFKFSNNTHRQ